jgi:hypothetical protein
MYVMAKVFNFLALEPNVITYVRLFAPSRLDLYRRSFTV